MRNERCAGPTRGLLQTDDRAPVTHGLARCRDAWVSRSDVTRTVLNMTERAGTFGQISRTNTVLRADGVEVRADEFEARWTAHFGLEEELPAEVIAGLDSYPFTVGDAVGSWHEQLAGDAGVIVNHSTNDLLILLRSVSAGDGRTAARTARVMFEHLVHYKEVKSNPAKAAQYLEHEHVTAVQVAERKIGLRLLRGRARKVEHDRLRRLETRSRGKMDAALRSYGTRFKSGWTAGETLFDLARRHGLESDYDTYRILSGVMHGSAGSVLGTRRKKGERVTHRLGPDYQLVPVAFLSGMSWWRLLLDELPEVPASHDEQVLRRAHWR